MHGWRETLEIKRILKVEPVHECIIQASNTGRLMHRDAGRRIEKWRSHFVREGQAVARRSGILEAFN